MSYPDNMTPAEKLAADWQSESERIEQALTEAKQAEDEERRATETVEARYKAIGRSLLEMKEALRVHSTISFKTFLCNVDGLSESRANELIRLANGEETLAEQRAKKAASVARSRAKKRAEADTTVAAKPDRADLERRIAQLEAELAAARVARTDADIFSAWKTLTPAAQIDFAEVAVRAVSREERIRLLAADLTAAELLALAGEKDRAAPVLALAA